MRAVFGLDEAKFNALAGRMDALWPGVLASHEGRVRAPGAGQPRGCSRKGAGAVGADLCVRPVSSF